MTNKIMIANESTSLHVHVQLNPDQSSQRGLARNYILQQLIHSFVRSFIRLFVHSFVHLDLDGG